MKTASQPARTPIAGRRALVMGLGAFGGGLGTARWLAREGARVTVTDLLPAERLSASTARLADLEIDFELGEHRPQTFRGADLVVANPAVPPDSRWLRLAREAGAEVTSEVALFLERVRGRLLAVTGTQGKSSTVSMAHQLLCLAGQASHLGGNIGGSLLGALDSIREDDVTVLELSSYQLEALPQRSWPARIEAVAITNILADHLERHGDRRGYRAAKARILSLVRDAGQALLPAGDAELIRTARAAGLTERLCLHGEGGELRLERGRFCHGEEELGAIGNLRVPGSFQIENALVALGLAHLSGTSASELGRAVSRLRGLEHRMQDLGVRGGVRVIDNGVSTTPDSTAAVLCDVPPTSLLLLGGQAKRLDYSPLARAVAGRELRVFVFGAARNLLESVLAEAGVEARAFDTLEDATAAALGSAPSGGVLLFSPACASFDAFTNFRARAERFAQLLPPPSP